MDTPAYRRVLLKLSGEALMGDGAFGIDANILSRLAEEIKALLEAGVEPALVIGGGNIFRGAGLTQSGLNKVRADQIGMLATVMNALAMQDFLLRAGVDCRVLSAFQIGETCEVYSTSRALEHLQQGRVVIFAAGTGNPLFTTDSAASLRAIEIEADLMIKATKVDGVYSADPKKDPSAQRYSRLSYQQVIEQRLGVMDTTAVVLCQEHKMPLRVLDMTKPNALLQAVMGHDEGSLIE